MALEDAKIDNGCLWFIPGSHKEVQKAGDVPVRFIRVKEEDIEREGDRCFHYKYQLMKACFINIRHLTNRLYDKINGTSSEIRRRGICASSD